MKTKHTIRLKRQNLLSIHSFHHISKSLLYASWTLAQLLLHSTFHYSHHYPHTLERQYPITNTVDHRYQFLFIANIYKVFIVNIYKNVITPNKKQLYFIFSVVHINKYKFNRDTRTYKSSRNKRRSS